MNCTKKELDLFIAHVVSALPDSLQARKTVLNVLIALLPRDDSEHRITIRTMIETLNAHETAQLTFLEIVRGASVSS